MRSPTVAMRSTALLLTLFGSAESISTRRALLRSGAAAAFTAVSPIAIPQPALADEDPDSPPPTDAAASGTQHELASRPSARLGRKDGEITSRAGYAGGNAGQKNGQCRSPLPQRSHDAEGQLARPDSTAASTASPPRAEVVAMNIAVRRPSRRLRRNTELFDDYPKGPGRHL